MPAKTMQDSINKFLPEIVGKNTELSTINGTKAEIQRQILIKVFILETRIA